MTERYQTKVDWWILLSAGLGPVVGVGVCLAVGEFWTALFVGLMMLGVGAVCWPCEYVLDLDALIVRSGVIKWRVPYREIERVQTTRNPLSSPAWSLDRLAISYGRNQIMISPVRQEEFLTELSYKTGLKRVDGGLQR